MKQKTSNKRRYCDHCNENVSASVYFRHKKYLKSKKTRRDHEENTSSSDSEDHTEQGM